MFSLLSKENAVLFPLLALGLVFITPAAETGKRLRHALLTLPYWGMNLAYIIIHNRFSGVQGVLDNFSFKDIFVIFKTIGAYTKIILTPFFPTHHFSMHHFDQNHLEFLVYFAVALLIVVFVVKSFCGAFYKKRLPEGPPEARNKGGHSLYTLLFFIFLLPVLDPELVPSYPKIVIRFAYIPAVFAGVFFTDIFHFFKTKRLKIVYGVLLAFVAVIWIFESYSFQVYFKDQHSHYEGLIRHYPDDGSLLLPLALIKAQQGDYNKSLTLVNHALEVNPKDRWLDVSEMGGLLKANLLVIAGEGGKGKALAEKIIGETRKDGMKYFGLLVLAKFHEKKGEFPTALRMLKEAETFGETSDLFFRMAVVYGKMQNYPPALRCLEKAKNLNPELKKYRPFKDFLLNAQQQKTKTGR